NSARAFFTRREFFQQTALGSALAGAALGTRRGGAAEKGNPFAYDLSRLEKTDPKLVHYEQVAQFRAPAEDACRIAAGPEDRVYIAGGNSVFILNRTGESVREIGLESRPRCLTVDGDGRVFVGLRDHVEVYDAQGERRARWTSLEGRPWLTGL